MWVVVLETLQVAMGQLFGFCEGFSLGNLGDLGGGVLLLGVIACGAGVEVDGYGGDEPWRAM